MEKLFEDKVRLDSSPGKYNDNTFDFIDRSAMPEVENIREVLNSWFDRYPSNESLELKKRLQVSFPPTFYELFLHELFLQQGFTITIHPIVPGTDRKPDFLLSKGNIEFYAEAKDAQGKSENEIGIEKIENAIYDGLNNMNSPDFFLMKRKLILKSGQPSIKKINLHFETEMQKYDADVISEQKEVTGLPHVSYEDDKVFIEMTLIPKIKSARGKAGIRPYGGGMGNVIIGGSDESIFYALKQKASRYGEVDKPYIICVNSTNDFGATEHGVKSALFGSLSFTYSTDPANRNERLEHSNDGFFFGERGPQFTRVSGVLVTNVDIGNLQQANHWLVKHPFTRNPLDFSVFDLSYTYVNGNKIETVPKKGIREILTY